MKNKQLGSLINLINGDVVSVVGAGGKTSLIHYLADFLEGRIIVSTSTRMYVPQREWNVYLDEPVCWQGHHEVVVSGQSVNNNKLAGINPYISHSAYDYWLIEADGSRNLPLKGWGPNEPVIIDETTVTIGILDITTLGMDVNEETVFRLNELRAISKIHNTVELSNLKDIVVHKKGLFKKSQGRLVLLINKVETESLKTLAKTLWAMIQEDPSCPKIDRCIMASVLEGSGEMEGQQ